MALYELTGDQTLSEVTPTTFAAAGVWERRDLQAALRKNIATIDADLMVVAEEFGEFEGSDRRIDLLCVDREARLVVIELERTTDGGHMELQALRYAAMVSSMTFEQLVDIYQRFLTRHSGLEARPDARQELADWIDESGSSDSRV
ncbi:hypothetical protein ACF3NT_08060 [Naumannella halotolerans]|uniref:Endonuclease NucS n=1 Tax=Naumannella halotolerans TaxID=993414 RepID=A0A4R7JBK7_9ACTN|nr:hypothetical protein [Naumannella halotolerans]TDT33993.1 hypothetical protein CLV29_1633 [Naumannella halotolerans]